MNDPVIFFYSSKPHRFLFYFLSSLPRYTFHCSYVHILPFPKCTKFLNLAYFIFLAIYFLFIYFISVFVIVKK